jgi:hypothetical protein
MAARSFATALVAAFFVTVNPPALAHDAPRAQAEREVPGPFETFIGTVHQVVIDDPTRGTSSRHLEIELDDGSLVPLNGDEALTLENGRRAQVSGRRNGVQLDVLTARTFAVAPRPTLKATVEVEGTLAILHADDFAHGRSEFVYELHRSSGGVHRLRIGSLPRSLAPGMRLRVSGQLGADAASLTPERITILAQPSGVYTNEAVVAKAATASSVLVIMANFSNTAVPSFASSQAQQVMTSNADSVANFFREGSYGQQVLNVSVTPAWVTMNLAQPASCNSSDWQAIGSAADAAARTLGAAYDPTAYSYVVYLFPNVPACGWLGLAYIGSPHKAWINGVGGFKTSAIAHEMGHNFGLLHAASLRCSSGSIGGSCSVSEYGDPFDTMGNQRAMHYNAMQKSRLAWIPSTSVKTHSGGTATYTLSPLEVAGGATYAVKIPTGSSNRTYWVEYRQPIGFDSPLSAFPNNGAQIRVASPFETLCSGCDSWSDDTQLLDMTLGTSVFTDGALVSGQTFSDSTYAINVTVVSATASALTVSVSIGGTAPIPVSTTTTVAVQPNPSTVGATVTLTAIVGGNSPTGRVSFTDNGLAIAGCGGLALARSGTSGIASCSTNALTAGTHVIVAAYSGDAGNLSSVSAGVSALVNATSLVDHYYQAILGRAPDAGGKAFWEGEIALGQSLGVDVKEAYMLIGTDFFNSVEYASFNTSNARYVSDLYEAFFSRTPDSTGLAYWTNQLASGLPRNIALYSFVFSQEFNTNMTGLFGSTSSRSEVYAVMDFYRGILGRFPDSAGFDYWVGRLRSAQCSTDPTGAVYATVDAISKQFLLSSEYLARNRSNGEYVSDLINAFLRRGSDLTEVAYWTNRLDTGVENREALRRDFVGSQEFSAHINAVIAEGC